jgi:hypothetical protein
VETNYLQMIVGAVAIVVGFGAVVAYPKLQYTAIQRLRGGWRALSLLPLAVMAVVVAVTVPAVIQGANLWPLYLIFVTPFATVYLGLLLFAHRRLDRASDQPPQ